MNRNAWKQQSRDRWGRWKTKPRASAAPIIAEVDLAGADGLAGDGLAGDGLAGVVAGGDGLAGADGLAGEVGPPPETEQNRRSHKKNMATRAFKAVLKGIADAGVGFYEGIRGPGNARSERKVLERQRERAPLLAKWRLEAFRAPIRYKSEEQVEAAWSRLLEVCEQLDATVRVDGLIEEHYTAPHVAPFKDSPLVKLSDLGIEGATVTDTRSVVLSDDMDKPRQTVVLAHEIAHLVDPYVSSGKWKKQPTVRSDSEIVAELAAHLFVDLYDINSTQRSWRYVEGWVNRALSRKDRATLKKLLSKDKIVSRVSEILQTLLPPDEVGDAAAIKNRVRAAFYNFARQPLFGHR